FSLAGRQPDQASNKPTPRTINAIPASSRRLDACENRRRDSNCAKRTSTSPRVRTLLAAVSAKPRNQPCDALAPRRPPQIEARQAAMQALSKARLNNSIHNTSTSVCTPSDQASVQVAWSTKLPPSSSRMAPRKPMADKAKNAPETSPSNAGRNLPRPAATAGSPDIRTTPNVATMIATMLSQDKGSPSTTKPNTATWMGSVLVQAVTTTKDRSRMAASISAVAEICASAPPSTNSMNSKPPCGAWPPSTSITMARNSKAKGKPNRNRTWVAPSVPSVAVRLRCTALRPACAAAAATVAGIQTQVQSMEMFLVCAMRARRYRQPARRS